MKEHPEVIEDMGMLPEGFHAAVDSVAQQKRDQRRNVNAPVTISKSALDYVPNR